MNNENGDNDPANVRGSRRRGRGRGRGRGGRGRGRHKGRGDAAAAAASEAAESPLTPSSSLQDTARAQMTGQGESTAPVTAPEHSGGDTTTNRSDRGGGGKSGNRAPRGGGGGRGRGRGAGRGRGRSGRGNRTPRSGRSRSPVPPRTNHHKEQTPPANHKEQERELTDTSLSSSVVQQDMSFSETCPAAGSATPAPAQSTPATPPAPAQAPDTTLAPEPDASNSNAPLEKPVLNLPPPPSTASLAASRASRKPGVPMILSRSAPVEHDPDAHMRHLSERLAEAALEEESTSHVVENDTTNAATGSSTKKTARKKKKDSAKRKKKKKSVPNPNDTEEDEEENKADSLVVEDVSPTDALKALPAQEVSITASTQVKIRRNESSASLARSDTTPTKISPDIGISVNGGKSKKGKRKKKGILSNDSSVNQKAARRFNNEVRACVERGDPDMMREILHDRHHHNFALDHLVLETVMKAYIMAAMFEDALYCLRNCTLPGTLSTLQTERILTCLPQNLRNSSAYTAADMINALCIATDFDKPTSRTYFLRIVRGIALEFLEEATSARDRICSSPCERLVRSALCVVNARLKRGKKPSELVVDPGDQLGVFVPDTLENRGIQAGDAVSILPYAGPYPTSAESLDRNMIEGTVINTNPMVLRLQDKTNADLYSLLTEPVEGNVYRIDKLANRMGFNRQLAAVVAITSPMGESKTRDPRRPCPQLIQAITAMDENIDRVMRQSNGRLPRGELTSTAALCTEAIPWNADDETEDMDQDALRASSRLALEKYGAFEGLNVSQQLAVEGATSNRLTLVQGPPGTGKTILAIRVLQHWARLAAAAAQKGENPVPIVATSDSNIAVDNLVEGCAAVGLRVVRLGRPEAIRPELLRYCIDRPSPSRDDGSQQSSYQQSSSQGYGSVPNFKERAKQLKSAQVICCTCIGSGGDILDALGPLEHVLVDEATQATEAAVLVPLMRGCRQLVLVGDHCQLPPTVLSTKAEEEGHGVPLFSRMVACGVPPFMLDTQYRMHPCIAMFPSDLFYGGLLKNGVSSPERRPLAGFPWPREEFPVAFMPIQGVEMDDGVSKYNQSEADTACNAVRCLLEGGQCSVSDIAVVTPYAAQARLIRRMLRSLQQNSGPPFIEVSSVDGFQGREKEAVVFSAVRSNDYGAIGFTSDWRRTNVSFTRARRALIVIGNQVTLRQGDPDTWSPWLAWADAHGINMDYPGQPRGRYDAEQLRRVRGGTTAAEMLKDVLERQQAQLKTAQQQQERAVRNAEGHIIAIAKTEEDLVDGMSTPKQLTLEEDLALLENTEGNWDDSDDEEKFSLRHSISKGTLTSASSSNDLRSATRSSTPTDAWDL